MHIKGTVIVLLNQQASHLGEMLFTVALVIRARELNRFDFQLRECISEQPLCAAVKAGIAQKDARGVTTELAKMPNEQRVLPLNVGQYPTTRPAKQKHREAIGGKRLLPFRRKLIGSSTQSLCNVRKR